jgi:hypothetical protein
MGRELPRKTIAIGELPPPKLTEVTGDFLPARTASSTFRRVAGGGRPGQHRAALGDFRKYQEPGVCISRELGNRPELKGRFTLTRSTFGLDERGALIFQGH